MRWLLDPAIMLTRGWTATYTRGLPHDLRAERREEIDSDLWDHQRLAVLEREPVTGTATHILIRLILGMPADVLWRVETGAAQSERRTSLNQSWPMRISLLLCSLPLAAFLFIHGLGMVIGVGEYDDRTQQVFWGVVLAAIPVIMLAGLWLCATMPRLGLGLLVTGVVATWVILFWMLPFTVPIGLVIIAFAIKRSGIAIWPFRANPSGPTGTA